MTQEAAARRGPARTPSASEAERRMWPLYAGGFLGPFGGAMVTPMLPELRDGLHTTLATAASSVTAYMIPFAVLMLCSGTLGERWGRSRTIRAAYLLYAVACLVCALAPNATVFLLGRALQGVGNAFTSPLLVAAISELVPVAVLGSRLGRFASLQAAGQAFAPLVGGGLAALDYRWAFVISTAAALGLATVPPPDTDRARAGGAAGWRALLNPRVAISCGFGFWLYLGTSGLMLLIALRGGDHFGLAPQSRGLVIACFGLAGLATGARMGGAADRWGIRPFGLACLLGFGAATAAAGVVPAVVLMAVMMALAGLTSTAGRVVINTLALRSTPTNRGGATSLTLAWQFLGSAVAPLVFLPLYDHGSRSALAFVIAALTVLPAAALLLVRVPPAATIEPAGQ